MSNTLSNQAAKSITCPACSLLCDDIALLGLTNNDLSCHKANQFFARPSTPQTPRIKGKCTSLADAIQAACELIQSSQYPIFAGMSTDVNGLRAVQSLVNITGGCITHLNATSSFRNYKVMQQFGWQTTTFTEMRNRADVIVLIATDAVTQQPRFYERLVWVEHAMFVKPNERQIIYLGGEGLNKRANGYEQYSPVKPPIVVPCTTSALPEVVAVLRALVNDQIIVASEVAGITVTVLKTIAQLLKAANYAVLVWNSKELDFPHAELTIQNICGMIEVLNTSTRAAALPLGGSDGDTSVIYAHTWLNGVVPPVPDIVEHDLLVWVNSFSPNATIPESTSPLVVLGASDSSFNNEPEVFIPIATPGLEANGTMFRGDGSVVLPLLATRASSLPTLAQVVTHIMQALQSPK